jgi:predicted regulator of Ras-like GTPase activity (Roadblock/LC7/MglB family)
VVADKVEKMNSILKELRSSVADVEAAVLLSSDAMALASDVGNDLDEDQISAMSASVLSLGERAAKELRRGVLDQVYIKGDLGYLLVMNCGPEAILAVLVSPSAKLGVLFMETKRTADELSKLFE